MTLYLKCEFVSHNGDFISQNVTYLVMTLSHNCCFISHLQYYTSRLYILQCNFLSHNYYCDMISHNGTINLRNLTAATLLYNCVFISYNWDFIRLNMWHNIFFLLSHNYIYYSKADTCFNSNPIWTWLAKPLLSHSLFKPEHLLHIVTSMQE